MRRNANRGPLCITFNGTKMASYSLQYRFNTRYQRRGCFTASYANKSKDTLLRRQNWGTYFRLMGQTYAVCRTMTKFTNTRRNRRFNASYAASTLVCPLRRRSDNDCILGGRHKDVYR